MFASEMPKKSMEKIIVEKKIPFSMPRLVL